jgi:hypothetical protein
MLLVRILDVFSEVVEDVGNEEELGGGWAANASRAGASSGPTRSPRGLRGFTQVMHNGQQALLVGSESGTTHITHIDPDTANAVVEFNVNQFLDSYLGANARYAIVPSNADPCELSKPPAGARKTGRAFNTLMRGSRHYGGQGGCARVRPGLCRADEAGARAASRPGVNGADVSVRDLALRQTTAVSAQNRRRRGSIVAVRVQRDMRRDD